MTESRPSYSETVVKTLFALSGNLCSFTDDRFPHGCDKHLTDPIWPRVRGEIAHICGYAANAPRHDSSMSVEQRNGFDNLILLCPNHHQQVDDLEPERFTVEVLREMKRKAENRGPSSWAPTEEQLT